MPVDTTNLKQIYERERNKRVTAATSGKTIDSRHDAAAADLAKDPWVDYDALARQDPILKEGARVKFLILGAGHNGILWAYHLIAAGFAPSDIVVVDEAGGFGGTWYYNRYPGLTCDVEGYCYLPLLEETGYVPKHRYSRGEEIRHNVEHIAEKFGIQGQFCTKGLSADWDEEERSWIVKLRRDLGPNHQDLNTDFTVRAQFLLPAAGLFLAPSAPALPGFETFKKNRHVFHTSRWDYNYTGGTQTDPNLHKLKDKVVGLIGTGATAVQVVPELAKHAKHLYVFQRTASYCGPRKQVETTPELWNSVTGKPGWQRERVRNLNAFLSDEPTATDENNLVKDGWSLARSWSALNGSSRANDLDADKVEEHIQRMLELDTKRAEEIRAHISNEVKDAETAEKLKPWYPGWCKRPTFHQDYLESFNRPNVTLVDTDGQGVEAYTERGVIVGSGAAGKEYELDTLILATGFATPNGEPPSYCLNMPIRGRGGRELGDKWKGPEAAALFGVTTNGFPNLFFWSMAGSSGGANLTAIFDIIARLVAHTVKEGSKQAQAASGSDDRLVLEVRKASEEAYATRLNEKRHWFAPMLGCTPGYFTGYGDKPKEAMNSPLSFWPAGILDYDDMLEKWKKESKLEEFDVVS